MDTLREIIDERLTSEQDAANLDTLAADLSALAKRKGATDEEINVAHVAGASDPKALIVALADLAGNRGASEAELKEMFRTKLSQE